ncbi:Tyr Aminotransferase 1, tyrosine aminotransferase 7 [Hibiscus trionum]|uniref:Tyr Aminotransferase 1, tyrosine aminotransferase 7 n=1 Tax=Hibiscus trionum TaxID=183268 RepID=A0A9W7J8E4_HIBTR|nr:Tyr Aminotransferase 1, tyrosine aminotransferase 7 [Hibiscus trionum]
MENGAVNHEMETASTITIKGILNVLMQNVDENNCKRLISLGMGDPTVYSCFHTFHVAGEAVVEALQSDKFNGYSPTVGLPQTRRFPNPNYMPFSLLGA